MPEFRAWRLAELHESAKDRILWIRGPLGIGKSTMAGYFIDILKCLYPKSTVAYFFCRGHQSGLTKAHDIVRTLAYQCMENDRSVRSILEALKHKDFRITENLGVAFLFEKLLLEPLRGTSKEIYIILDGLDEADFTQDESDPSALPDLHILLKCLSKLKSTRLLFISRPNANVSSVLPNVIIKTVTKVENERDINAYVTKAIAESERLRTHFKNERVNPITYFQEKSDGIFLWVVLVINQLGKAKTKSMFRKYLQGFSNASGSMDKFYETTLSRFDQDDRPWIKEIVQWLVVAEGQLSVEELKRAVEWCLEDEHVDFQSFLEVDCGSILQILSAENKPTNVQLIHETFRSFLLNASTCPPEFLINEATAHGHLALTCLQRLPHVDSTPDNVYCLTKWVAHLSKATSTQQSKDLLVSLHQFFTSDGVKNWIKHGLPTQHSLTDGLRISIEEQDLQYICEWLQNCQLDDDENIPDEYNGNVDELWAESVTWRKRVLANLPILGESIGKVAARIWLHECIDLIGTVRQCFLLGLKYYWKRKNRSQTNLNELNELVATDFKDISIWSGDIEQQQSINKKNIGVALFSILKWDECIRYLDLDDDPSDNRSGFQWYLGVAFMAKRDYQRAIKPLKIAFDENPNKYRNVECLWKAYGANGDYDGAIETLEATTDRKEGERWLLWRFLAKTYKEKVDHDGGVDSFQKAIDKYPNEIWIYLSLADILIDKKDYDGAIKALTSAIDKGLYSPYWGILVLSAHKGKSDYQGAINLLAVAIENCPGAEVWTYFIEAHEMKGDYDGAVSVMEMTIDKSSSHSLRSRNNYYNCYDSKYVGSIKALEVAVENHPSASLLWDYLGHAYLTKGDFDGAIAALEIAAQDEDASGFPGTSLSLFRANRDKGDYDRAIKLFETSFNKAIVSKAPLDGQELWCSSILELYKAKSDYHGAIKTFETIIKAPHKMGKWGLTGLINAYVAKGDYDGAIRRAKIVAFETQIEASPSLEFVILDAYIASGDYDGAINRFNNVVGKFPTESWPWNLLGAAHKAKGDHDAAIETFRSAFQQIPVDYSFLRQLGDMYLTKLDFDAAINTYKTCIEMAPSKSFMWVYFSVRPFDNRLFPTFSISIDETLPESFLWHKLAEAYKGKGDYDAAVKVYSSAIEGYKAAIHNERNGLLCCSWGMELDFGTLDMLTRDNLRGAVAWTALGEAYKAKGDIQSALGAFKMAIEMEENSWLHKVIRDLEVQASLEGVAENTMADE
jgi:tetratricopeptide (TPR) repeat protein